MLDFDQLVQNATAIAPRMEFALGQKYFRIPPREIAIAVDGALFSYCKSAWLRTLENEEPWGYMWRAAERILHKYLLHIKREAPMGKNHYEYDANDKAAHDFNIRETLSKILPTINKSYREILELHKIEERSFEEIAELKGKSVEAVRQQYHRALIAAREIAAQDGLCNPPPATIMPNGIKINLENLKKVVSHFRGNRYLPLKLIGINSQGLAFFASRQRWEFSRRWLFVIAYQFT